MKARKVVIWVTAAVIAVAIVAGLAIMLIPRLSKAEEVATTPFWPTEGWRSSTPEEQGFDSVKLAEGLLAMQKQDIDIHSLLIIRNGSVILDAYFSPYDGSFPHDLASVTKSVMTTLIGIAADQGKIVLDQPMLAYFSGRTIANLDERKEKITVRHLAGMVNGFVSGDIAGDEITLNAMRGSPDWVQAALDREMLQEPGKSFCYDSPGMHLLSAILQEATGMTALDFARQYLFEPLGIDEVAWETDPQGYTHGWGDLHLKPLDAAKIGYLWLNHGAWEGKQIVSADWVRNSVKAQVDGIDDGYGYGWWVSKDSYYAFGRGGQNIKIVPSLNTVIVTTASNLEYDQIVPYLLAAVVDPEQALAPNPEGVARLNEALDEILQPQAAQASIPPPETARRISGKVYTFERNSIKLESMSFKFDGASQADLQLKLEGSNQLVEGAIGLDGKYVFSAIGWGLRGYWAGPQTFILDIFDKGQTLYRLSFQGEAMLLDSEGVKIEGKVK